MITVYVGENATFMRQYLAGEPEIGLISEGAPAKRMRAWTPAKEIEHPVQRGEIGPGRKQVNAPFAAAGAESLPA